MVFWIVDEAGEWLEWVGGRAPDYSDSALDEGCNILKVLYSNVASAANESLIVSKEFFSVVRPACDEGAFCFFIHGAIGATAQIFCDLGAKIKVVNEGT